MSFSFHDESRIRLTPGTLIADGSISGEHARQGANYIKLTSRFKDKLTKEELELWQGVEKLVKTYETSL
jgi:hypothetical protein